MDMDESRGGGRCSVLCIKFHIFIAYLYIYLCTVRTYLRTYQQYTAKRGPHKHQAFTLQHLIRVYTCVCVCSRKQKRFWLIFVVVGPSRLGFENPMLAPGVTGCFDKTQSQTNIGFQNPISD